MSKSEITKRNLIEYIKLYITISDDLATNLQRMSLKSLDALSKEIKGRVKPIETILDNPEPLINYQAGRSGNIPWLKWYRTTYNSGLRESVNRLDEILAKGHK